MVCYTIRCSLIVLLAGKWFLYLVIYFFNSLFYSYQVVLLFFFLLGSNSVIRPSFVILSNESVFFYKVKKVRFLSFIVLFCFLILVGLFYFWWAPIPWVLNVVKSRKFKRYLRNDNSRSMIRKKNQVFEVSLELIWLTSTKNLKIKVHEILTS